MTVPPDCNLVCESDTSLLAHYQTSTAPLRAARLWLRKFALRLASFGETRRSQLVLLCHFAYVAETLLKTHQLED